MKRLLIAKNISKTYIKNGDDIQVLRDIHLSISKGEILVLMGPSGSGKSTLLNILGTLDTDYSGDITIDDINISPNENSAYIRASKLGFVFQFHHLLPEFTIMENLQIPILISDIVYKEKEIMDLLKYVGMKDRINHYPDEISGGERQRVAVIRAFINKPLLILADEPTGNLDRESGLNILRILKELNKEGKTVIMITHNKEQAKAFERTITLTDGEAFL